ncbi:mCG1034542, partial [Mus musculus]
MLLKEQDWQAPQCSTQVDRPLWLRVGVSHLCPQR